MVVEWLNDGWGMMLDELRWSKSVIEKLHTMFLLQIIRHSFWIVVNFKIPTMTLVDRFHVCSSTLK